MARKTILLRATSLRTASVAAQRLENRSSSSEETARSPWFTAAMAAAAMGATVLDLKNRSKCCGIVGVVGTPDHGDAR